MNQSIEELITELSMTYSYKMHLILEGDDDLRFFRASLKGVDKVNVLCACGADDVMNIIHEIDKLKPTMRISPTLGIVDRDYRIPLGTLLQSPNLIASDARDFECMMFDSPSFNAVLAEFGSDKKIQAFGGCASISAAAIASAKTVGKIRYHTNKLKTATTFKQLELPRIVNSKTLAINPNELIKHLNARQGINGFPLSDNAFENANEACASAICNIGQPYFKHDLLLCRGHDLMEILAIGFRSLFGSRTARESSRENVEALFRLNYVAYFKSSQMAKSIDAWLVSNTVAPHVALV